MTEHEALFAQGLVAPDMVAASTRTMIDRVARDNLAEAIRHLASGRITNDQYEDRLPWSSIDPAVWEIHRSGAWRLYSDLSEYHLQGRHRLQRRTRREVARWILFLKSDQEYEWPRFACFETLLLTAVNLVTCGLVGLLWQKLRRPPGPTELWPFFRSLDHDAAVAHPPYLAGAR